VSTTGLTCTRCGKADDTRTLASRPHVSGRSRRHLCGCGHRFTTIEVVVSDSPRLLVGCILRDATLTKAKLIARVSSLLEKSL